MFSTRHDVTPRSNSATTDNGVQAEQPATWTSAAVLSDYTRNSLTEMRSFYTAAAAALILLQVLLLCCPGRRSIFRFIFLF